MPIREYRCKCGHRWEVFRVYDEIACPKCGGENVEKLVSVPGYRRDRTIRGEER